MRDPHVETLYYTIESHKSISYKDPEPMHFSNDLAQLDLADGHLAVKPTEHFADEATAKQAVGSYLTAWEMDVDLKSNIGTIRFHFDRSEIIDRDPPKPEESVTLQAQAGDHIVFAEKVTSHLQHSKYPQPPSAFSSTRMVEMGYRRWINYNEGKEPLQSMAYFVLTQLEKAAGNRKQAATTFKIDYSVLSKIGELSSTKGDGDTARKANASLVDLTNAEKQWLEQTTRKIIYQMGLNASGKPFDRITFSDLPTL